MKHTNRLLSLLLTGAMLLGLLPAVSTPARAATGQYIEVYCGEGQIGNGGMSPTDLFMNFNRGTPGFVKEIYYNADVSGYNIKMDILEQDNAPAQFQGADFTLDIDKNPILKELANSSTAQYMVKFTLKNDGGAYDAAGHNDYEKGRIDVSDSSGYHIDVAAENVEDDRGEISSDTGWQSLTNRSWIKMAASISWSCDSYGTNYNENGEGDNGVFAEVEIHLYVRDQSGPTFTGYSGSCSDVSTKTTNDVTGANELLLKLGVKNADDPDDYYYTATEYSSDTAAKESREWVAMDFNFSKAVKPENPTELVDHYLFTNTAGTGYLNQGKDQCMTLQPSQNSYNSTLSYKYTANYGDFSGNIKIPGGGYIVTGTSSGGASEDKTRTSMLDKIRAADFHDAAGNPVTGISAKGTNIFDSSQTGGFDVIVDAMPPTYSRVSNGISPDILTQMVLNENDTVDFIVSFSEATITRRDMDNANTYLMLSNGDKAYFQSKSADGKRWVFHYEIPDGTDVETTLLKVIALANDALDSSLSETTGKQEDANDSAHTYGVDARTIVDYVGNRMVDRANEDSSTNTKQIESSISWAGLTVDNTPPDIAFNYRVYGTGAMTKGTDSAWGQAAKVSASAEDPAVPVAQYDPEYDASDNATRPSKGIYRPDNTTGSTASATGLIFYVWTRSVTPPGTGANFEAIKRYSLTGEQPKTVANAGYASAWNWDGQSLSNYVGDLMIENNFSEIVPPDEAMTGDGDGAWYLHVWTADMSWDSARQLMQYDKAKKLQYNSGYDNAAYLALKQEQSEAAVEAQMLANPNGTPDYDAAWNAVKETVYTTAYTPEFIGWLDASGSNRYSDAAMLYARSRALLQMAQYENTAVWTLDDYRHEDSNWTLRTTRLLLDNTKPSADAEFQTDNMTGDGTAAAELPFTVSDETSGIDTEKVYYQWVLKKADGSQTPDEVRWVKVAPDSGTDMPNALGDDLDEPAFGKASATFTAKTLNNVIEDGEHLLYLKYNDAAGNETVVDSGELTVTVNTANNLVCAFGPADALENWRNSIIPTVQVTGVTVGKLEYAVTHTVTRPDDGFTELAADTAGEKDYTYTLPALSDAENTREDGTWYVHVLIYENAGQSVEPHYYRREYRLDRTKPEVFLNPDGFGSPQDSIDTVVSFSDELSGMSDTAQYQISTSDAEIATGDAGWLTVPADGRITLRADAAGTYYLHILAVDRAGNVTMKISAPFALRGTDIPQTVLPPYSCQLLTTYVAEDGKTYGVANLALNTPDKAGYRYSVTTGDYWCNWLPYMSMIRLELPDGYRSGDLKVKFRAPDGTVGEPKAIRAVSGKNNLWATAEFDSTFKRQSGTPLTFLMEHPDDVILTPVAAQDGDPLAVDAGDGNFTVSTNGVYSFTLSSGTQTASSPLTVVVDLFDDTAPDAYLSYSEIAPTNGTVVVTVMADEPIRVNSLQYKYVGEDTFTDVAPRAQYGFERNGMAKFTVEDEAHNEATVFATVTNIDKTPPSVKVTSNYDLYKTVGTPLIASGATLEVKKDEDKEGFEKENFGVVNNDRKATKEIGQNGSYEFIVQDKVGNLTTVTHTQENIVKALPGYTVTYAYQNGDPVTDTSQKNDQVLATVTFKTLTDGRSIYSGAAKIDEDRTAVEWDEATSSFKTVVERFTNKLTLSDGKYVYTRAYSANGETVLVFCDDLGNVERVPITIKGIDSAAPTLKLNKSTVVIDSAQEKRLGELTPGEVAKLFGGYAVTDNASAADQITVTVTRSDDALKDDADKGRLDEVGKFTLVYTAADGAGNMSYAEQTLIVIPADGLLIEAGDRDDNSYALLSGSSVNNAILPDNHVKFRINEERMQAMFYTEVDNNLEEIGKTPVCNTAMRYDILYTPGLYREGQLKTIATQLTVEQLTEQDFKVTFPKAGWYTIIIRNQERTREFTTFFIASTSD